MIVITPVADHALLWDALDKLIAQGKGTDFDAVHEFAGKEMADPTIRTQRQRHKAFHAKA